MVKRLDFASLTNGTHQALLQHNLQDPLPSLHLESSMVRYSVRTSYVLFRFQGLPILRRQIEFEIFIRVRFDFGKDALGITNPVVAFVVSKSNGRFDTGMHPFARIGNICREFSRRDRTDTSSEIRSTQVVGTGPLICSGSEHDIINRLIMIFRVVIRRKSNNDRSSRNNNCKKVGNVIKPWMLSTQESFQENPHILDRSSIFCPIQHIHISLKIRAASRHP